jgi:hypothetical protein
VDQRKVNRFEFGRVFSSLEEFFQLLSVIAKRAAIGLKVAMGVEVLYKFSQRKTVTKAFPGASRTLHVPTLVHMIRVAVFGIATRTRKRQALEYVTREGRISECLVASGTLGFELVRVHIVQSAVLKGGKSVLSRTSFTIWTLDHAFECDSKVSFKHDLFALIFYDVHKAIGANGICAK